MKRFAFVLLLAPLAACSREAAAVEKAATPVRVASVVIIEPALTERYSASILPGRQVTLAFRVGGFVTGLHQTRGSDGRGRALEPGDTVAGGAVLARLRAEDYEIQVQQAQSAIDSARESEAAARGQLVQAEAKLAKAQADFARAEALLETKSVTRPDFDSAQAQLDASRGEVQAARAQVEAASAQIRTAEASLASSQLALRDSVLTAPFAASVVARYVEIGALVGGGTQAYALADISFVKAAFAVPDSVAVQLKPGAPVAIAIEALPDNEITGLVDSIAAVADEGTRLYQVEVSLRNDQRLLRPGMIASLAVQPAMAPQPVTVVPLGAVVRDRQGGGTFGVMVVENGVARHRAVTLGAALGEQLAVTSGVTAGERVIEFGATLVNDGEAVEVIP